MRLLEEIRLTNLLSFGRETAPLPLRPLNVLIGPNGSGKSNFVEAVSCLRSSTSNLGNEVRGSGGILDWLGKGARRPTATVDVVVENRPHPDRKSAT